MFHTPNTDIVKYQARSMDKPLVETRTRGVKEVELEDLKKALRKAIEKHGIEGVSTGALYSNYQRSRIERICDELGLKVFSPLWHVNQYEYFKRLLKEGFEIVFSSVAAMGLDKSWVGKKITMNDLEKLRELEKKYGLNVAGEGGEFESLVLNAPLFKKRIVITDFEIISEGEYNHRMIVKKVKLVEKDITDFK